MVFGRNGKGKCKGKGKIVKLVMGSLCEDFTSFLHDCRLAFSFLYGGCIYIQGLGGGKGWGSGARFRDGLGVKKEKGGGFL